MKTPVRHSTLLLFLFSAAIAACQQGSDAVSPEDALLYRSWQLLEVRQANQPVYKPDPARPTIVTFKPSGEYEENNSYYFCCGGVNRFVRQGNQLVVSNAGGAFPPACASVLCLSINLSQNPSQPRPNWVLDSLSAERLVLDRGNTTKSVYQAVQ